ncbi:MAG: prepilin-type N-terminal cleavage/methylation domain-containing protein, partial [Pseudomonadota bacterium]|nr:prepilin-type N-terminal cleavage/methylation domain-containing protein [Pseudomonadota bacterium]
MKRRQHGLALIELLFAVALAALVTAALGSLVGLLLKTQTHTRSSHELANQARFALTRVIAALRSGSAAVSSSTSPQLVVTVGTKTLSYSFNAVTSQLSETDSASGTSSVIADNVSAFDATLANRIGLPVNYGALSVGGTLAVPVAQVNL